MRDNTITQHAANNPGRASTTANAGVVARPSTADQRAVEHLCRLLDLDERQRSVLRLALLHVLAGGILLSHKGDLVLTWEFSGISELVRLPDPS